MPKKSLCYVGYVCSIYSVLQITQITQITQIILYNLSYHSSLYSSTGSILDRAYINQLASSNSSPSSYNIVLKLSVTGILLKVIYFINFPSTSNRLNTVAYTDRRYYTILGARAVGVRRRGSIRAPSFYILYFNFLYYLILSYYCPAIILYYPILSYIILPLCYIILPLYYIILLLSYYRPTIILYCPVIALLLYYIVLLLSYYYIIYYILFIA